MPLNRNYERESMEETYAAMLIVGPPGFADRDSLDDYEDLEESADYE